MGNLPNYITNGAYVKATEAASMNILVVAPDEVALGNRLLLATGTRGVGTNPGTTYTGPAGWTNIASVSQNTASELRVWTKIAEGTESSLTHTIVVANGGAGATICGVIWMFDNAADSIEGLNSRKNITTTISAVDVIVGGANRLAFDVMFTQNISTLTATFGGTTGGNWIKISESDSTQNAHMLLYTCPVVSQINLSSGSAVGAGASNWFSWGGAFYQSVQPIDVTADGLSDLSDFGNVSAAVPHGVNLPAVFGSNIIISIEPSIVGIRGIDVSCIIGDVLAAIPSGVSQDQVCGVPQIFSAYPYNTGETDSWCFEQYGHNVFATNNNDNIQVYSLGAAGGFADLGGDAPRAKFLGVVKNFLVAGNTDDADGRVPERVRWCALDNPFSWTVNATTQADFQDLYGEGGSNQAIATGLTQADAVILQERAVWRMTYQGPPSVFTFDLMEGVRGTPAPGSVIVVGGTCFYRGEDGFYGLDGSQSLPIGRGRVDRMFELEANPALFYRMCSAADIARKLIFWSYSTANASFGNPDKILVFNWGTGEWSVLVVDTEVIWRSQALGYTLEDLDSIGDIDSILSTLDSTQWSGKRLQLSAFDTNHGLSHFSGPNMPATITTNEITVSDPKNMLVKETWPIVDTDSSSTGIKIAVGTRERAYDTVSFAIATTINPVGYCPQRVGNQYLRFQVSISSSVVWNKVTGVDVKLSEIGKR